MRNFKKNALVMIYVAFLVFLLVGCYRPPVIDDGYRIDSVFNALFKKIDAVNLKDDFTLPLNMSGVELKYESSNTSIIKVEMDEENSICLFDVTPPAVASTSIDISVTLTSNDVTKVKSKTLIVIEQKNVYDIIPYPFQGEMILLSKAAKDYYGYTGLNPKPNNTDKSQKILVLPVQFEGRLFSPKNLSDISKAFFGTSAQTGYESVKSYYEKSSYGELNLVGEVLEPYTASKSYAEYQNQFSRVASDQTIIKELMDYHDASIDFSLYDANNDGRIDGIYVIYSYDVTFEVVPDNDTRDFWWAWCSQYRLFPSTTYDGVKPGFYVWAGVDFLYERMISPMYGNPITIPVNASVLIHETGHMFGLEDYYDYYPKIGPENGLGGLDMMDSNMGDHCSFSKIMLGWVTPMVVNNTITIKIRPFSDSGDVILIPGEWNGSYFSEYLLIDYYNLNSLNSIYAGHGLYSNPGVRIYHVSAELGKNTQNYPSYHYNDNSDTSRKLIKLLEASNGNNIESNSNFTQSEIDGVLYTPGSVNVLKGFKWYSSHLGSKDPVFTIKVTEMNASGATILITYNW